MSIRFKFCIMIMAIFISIAFTAAQDYTVGLSSGGYLIDGTGMTLYITLNDAPGNGISRCIGDCSTLWPPFYTGYIKVSPELNTSEFDTILRSDGKLQTTYNEWPLYYYNGDSKPGDTIGDGKQGIWHLMMVR